MFIVDKIGANCCEEITLWMLLQSKVKVETTLTHDPLFTIHLDCHTGAVSVNNLYKMQGELQAVFGYLKAIL